MIFGECTLSSGLTRRKGHSHEIRISSAVNIVGLLIDRRSTRNWIAD